MAFPISGYSRRLIYAYRVSKGIDLVIIRQEGQSGWVKAEIGQNKNCLKLKNTPKGHKSRQTLVTPIEGETKIHAYGSRPLPDLDLCINICVVIVVGVAVGVYFGNIFIGVGAVVVVVVGIGMRRMRTKNRKRVGSFLVRGEKSDQTFSNAKKLNVFPQKAIFDRTR